MKKILFVTVLVMAALAVNGQKTTIKVTDLPKSITGYITNDYAGYTIKDAFKNVANNVTTYEVAVAKGTTSETLIFDKDGKFINKMAVKTGTPSKNATHPTSEKTAHKK
jgi:hypothetical protein